MMKNVEETPQNGRIGRLFSQLSRFAVVGGTAFLIDYGLLFVLTELAGIEYLVSSALSFSVSVIYNYLLSTHWVFDVDATKHNTAINLLVFTALSIVGLGINQLLMYLLVEKVAIHYLIAKIAATAIVMVYNFITRKLFLER